LLKGVAEGLIVAFHAADEHSSLKAADDAVCCGGRFYFWANSALRHSIFQNRPQERLPFAEGFPDVITQYGIPIIGVDGCVEKRAATGKSGAINEVCDVLLKPVGVIRNRVEVLTAFSAGDGPGVVFQSAGRCRPFPGRWHP